MRETHNQFLFCFPHLPFPYNRLCSHRRFTPHLELSFFRSLIFLIFICLIPSSSHVVLTPLCALVRNLIFMLEMMRRIWVSVYIHIFIYTLNHSCINVRCLVLYCLQICSILTGDLPSDWIKVSWCCHNLRQFSWFDLCSRIIWPTLMRTLHALIHTPSNTYVYNTGTYKYACLLTYVGAYENIPMLQFVRAHSFSKSGIFLSVCLRFVAYWTFFCRKAYSGSFFSNETKWKWVKNIFGSNKS